MKLKIKESDCSRSFKEAKQWGKYDGLHYLVAGENIEAWDQNDYIEVMEACRKFAKIERLGKEYGLDSEEALNKQGKEIQRLVDIANENAGLPRGINPYDESVSMKESDMIKFGSRDEDLGSLEYALEKYVGKPVEKAKQYLRDLGFDMFVMAGPSKRDETWEEYTTDKDNSGSVSVKLYFDLDSDPKNPRRKLNGKLTDFFVDRYN